MTLDDIKSLVGTLSAPYRARGRRVWAGFNIEDQDGEIKYDIHVHEFVNGNAQAAYKRYFITEDNIDSAVAEAREFAATFDDRENAEAKTLAAVLGYSEVHMQAAE